MAKKKDKEEKKISEENTSIRHLTDEKINSSTDEKVNSQSDESVNSVNQNGVTQNFHPKIN